MRAELIFSGTELLLGQIVNTNAQLAGQRLAEQGVAVYRQVTVGDNLERLAEAIRQAAERAEVVLVGGGLGPTEDDLAREALAAATGLALVEDPAALAQVVGFFRERGLDMPVSNRKQALLPAGAQVLPNPVGTAPGVLLRHAGRHYFLLPGPPREYRLMLENHVLPCLRGLEGGEGIILSRVLKFCGIGEAALEERVRDLLHTANPTVAPLAKVGEVHLRLTARAPGRAEAESMLDPVEDAIRQRVGRYLFGRDEETLEEVVGRLLRRHGLTLAVAESCSGGLLAHRLTNVPGSSDYFLLGAVTYSNQAKVRLLEVPAGVLAAHGAVSEETARAMASAVRRLAGADVGVGITGIAGPGGGSAEKPVGLVYLALDGPGGTRVRREMLPGERVEVKERAAQSGLVLLWRTLC